MLDISTPSVRTDQRLAGEFRPRTLEAWLDRLPRTDPESTLQQLYKALSTQNRVVLEPVLRLQLMELYLSPFRELYGLHHADLRAISRVPLHPHYRNRQETMLSMLDAMAAGYKLAASDLAAGRQGGGRDSSLALALQRALYCLGEVLVTAYELYLRPPGGTWREAHELYRCAERAEICTLPVAAPPGAGEMADVLGTYMSILLLGASSPHGLLPGEARRLYELAPQWRRALRLSAPDALPGEPGHYRIRLLDDSAPFPVSKSRGSVDDATRVLKTLGVAREMHQILTDLTSATTRKAMQKVLGAGMQPVDVELFRRVGRVLGEVDIVRTSNRFNVRQELELHVGFDRVYRACNGGRAFEAPDATFSTDAAEATAEDEAGEQFIDLSEPMLGVPIDGDGEGGVAASSAGDPTGWSGRSVNQSAGGMCVVLPRSPDLRVKVGDIAACRGTETQRWQLGVLRWMRVSSKEIRFGLQFLGPVAVPVAAAAPGGQGDERGLVPAIWLPENPALKQGHSIILPRAADDYPPVLEIHGGDAPAALRLLRRVERTGDYEHYLVALDSSPSDSHSSRSS